MEWTPGDMAHKLKRTFGIPIVGDKRIKHRFLILPKTIGKRTRWLEWAKWCQEYKTVHYYYYGDVTKWFNEIWVD